MHVSISNKPEFKYLQKTLMKNTDVEYTKETRVKYLASYKLFTVTTSWVLPTNTVEILELLFTLQRSNFCRYHNANGHSKKIKPNYQVYVCDMNTLKLIWAPEHARSIFCFTNHVASDV